MNLRDKLRAVSAPAPRPAPRPEPAAGDCWRKEVTRPLDEFPGAFDLSRATLMLMQQEELPAPLDPTRILYLDTETTGLSGGAGTVAFQVGLGFLREDGFHVRQLVMRDYPEERYLLRQVQTALEQADVLCTFNGRTFDVPLLRSRFLMNRMDPEALELPHIDLLHIARRVFKLRLKRCNLGHLEEQVLGIPRENDLPGAEVPERFFRYLRTGEFALLDDVLRHNEQDIASLCVLLSRMTWLYEHPERIGHSEDLFAMGVALERASHLEEARRCYRLLPSGALHAQGQLRMAAGYRREGNRREAARLWEEMIARGEGGVTPYVELAKHLEHHERDLPRALEMTRQAMLRLAEPRLTDSDDILLLRESLEKRYQRLKRKAQDERLRTQKQNG